MKTKKFLTSAGQECSIPNQAEAAKIFSRENLVGDIKFGILAPEMEETCGNLLWVCFDNENFHGEKAFSCDNQPIKTGTAYFQEIPLHNVFLFGRSVYMLVNEKFQGITIKKINIYNHEELIEQKSELLDYPPLDLQLCKIQTIGREKKFLTVMWIGFDEEENSIYYFNAFEEDGCIMNDYSPHEIDRIPLDPGECFFHKSKLWKVDKDENKKVFFYPTLKVQRGDL